MSLSSIAPVYILIFLFIWIIGKVSNLSVLISVILLSSRFSFVYKYSVINFDEHVQYLWRLTLNVQIITAFSLILSIVLGITISKLDIYFRSYDEWGLPSAPSSGFQPPSPSGGGGCGPNSENEENSPSPGFNPQIRYFIIEIWPQIHKWDKSRLIFQLYPKSVTYKLNISGNLRNNNIYRVGKIKLDF